ncbi:hypothetical protein BGZ73_001620 [Actinomortierella ambigua]|nr:hypothetical protein BGZ73_001620 [Actinomortierella ambigua]
MAGAAALQTLVTLIKDRILAPKGGSGRTRGQRALILAIVSTILLAMRYPNRAILTRARPDLKAISWRGLPLLGNTVVVLRNRHRFLDQLSDSFEEMKTDVLATTILGLGQIIAINEPVCLEHVLKTNFENYEKGAILNTVMRQVLGDGIFDSDGQIWRMHRKTASHVFSTKIYRQLIDGCFHDHTQHLCAVLDQACAAGQPVDLQALFLRLTLDAFAKLSFGLDINSLGKDGKDPFGSAFDFAVQQTDMRFMNPLWRITEVFSGNARRMKQAVAVIDRYAFDAIRGRKQETEEERVKRQTHGREDLLDLFLKYRDDEGRALSDLELRDVYVNFIIAGRDTTAQALSWMYYEVMRNPTVQQNLWKEIDRINTPKATYEMLTKEMRYSHATFLEALRLYPPVPRNLKTAVADDVLPNGVQVKAGDRIMFSTYAIGRNKDVWGPQAREFQPERWFEGNATEIEKGLLDHHLNATGEWPKVRKESQYKFSSFNAGPRICLGQTFATLEALTVINAISSRFEFKLVPGQPPAEPLPSLTIPMKRPLMVTVHRRQL